MINTYIHIYVHLIKCGMHFQTIVKGFRNRMKYFYNISQQCESLSCTLSMGILIKKFLIYIKNSLVQNFEHC